MQKPPTVYTGASLASELMVRGDQDTRLKESELKKKKKKDRKAGKRLFYPTRQKGIRDGQPWVQPQTWMIIQVACISSLFLYYYRVVFHYIDVSLSAYPLYHWKEFVFRVWGDY